MLLSDTFTSVFDSVFSPGAQEYYKLDAVKRAMIDGAALAARRDSRRTPEGKTRLIHELFDVSQQCARHAIVIAGLVNRN